MRPIYTCCLYRHALYARVYLRDAHSRWPITNSRINGWHLLLHSARIERSRFVVFPMQAHRTPHRNILQWKSLFHPRSTCHSRICGVSWSSDQSMTVEFLLRKINGAAMINSRCRENIREDVVNSWKLRLPISQMASFDREVLKLGMCSWNLYVLSENLFYGSTDISYISVFLSSTNYRSRGLRDCIIECFSFILAYICV